VNLFKCAAVRRGFKLKVKARKQTELEVIIVVNEIWRLAKGSLS